MISTNCKIGFIAVVLFVCTQSVVEGSVYCQGPNIFQSSTYCTDNQYCCGEWDNECCEGPLRVMDLEGPFYIFLAGMIFLLCCCPILCYRCCCRRTTSRGFVYSQAGQATAVSVTLPAQCNQPTPYPTVVPYPQQTPYPPQHATNPYFGVPPPPYGYATQADFQQAQAPTSQNVSAPYLNS